MLIWKRRKKHVSFLPHVDFFAPRSCVLGSRRELSASLPPSRSPPSEKEQLAVPRGAAEALDELHAAVSLQVLPGVLGDVPPDLQALEVVKVGAAQLPQPPGCGAVALPGLRLQQEVLADGGQAREQPEQAGVPVVQVDPHGDGQAQTQVEAGGAVPVEVLPEPVGAFGDVQGDEGDVAGQRVVLLSPLDEGLVQVQAQQMDSALVRLLSARRRRNQMLVEGDAQFLPFAGKRKTACCTDW